MIRPVPRPATPIIVTHDGVTAPLAEHVKRLGLKRLGLMRRALADGYETGAGPKCARCPAPPREGQATCYRCAVVERRRAAREARGGHDSERAET